MGPFILTATKFTNLQNPLSTVEYMAHPFQLMQILMNKDAYVCQTHLLLKFLFSMYYFFYVPPCPLAYSILNYTEKPSKDRRVR